jgi:hypothetical protein
MGREWRTDYERAHEALHTGKLAETDRSSLRSLNHSFTLDFILGFEREDEARRVVAVRDKRLGRFGLALHPDKTRLLPFWRPPTSQPRGKGPATVDFVGFTFYWA